MGWVVAAEGNEGNFEEGGHREEGLPLLLLTNWKQPFSHPKAVHTGSADHAAKCHPPPQKKANNAHPQDADGDGEHSRVREDLAVG